MIFEYLKKIGIKIYFGGLKMTNLEFDEIEDYVIRTRRFLHENPELSGEELNTSDFLKKEVTDMGLEIYNVKGNGFYSILDSGKPGKTLGLRTDIDALPILESEYNLKGYRKCRSKLDGVFHACGHDGHMAILLGSMRVLIENKDSFSGKIIFIFEEGEERGCGIDAMVEALSNYKLDAIYGNHLSSSMNTGSVSAKSGPVLAGSAMVDFTIRGRGGHASRPDLSISPIFAATNVINGIASAWSNRLDVRNTVTLGLSTINGGTAYNVIPNEVRVTGTLRFFDVLEGQKAVNLIKKVGDLTAQAHECEFIDNGIALKAQSVVNDKGLAELFSQVINDYLEDCELVEEIWFASESFAKYRRIAPLLFTFIGTKNDDLGSGAEHHNELFDIDEDSLIIGVKTMVHFALSFLN